MEEKRSERKGEEEDDDGAKAKQTGVQEAKVRGCYARMLNRRSQLPQYKAFFSY